MSDESTSYLCLCPLSKEQEAQSLEIGYGRESSLVESVVVRRDGVSKGGARIRLRSGGFKERVRVLEWTCRVVSFGEVQDMWFEICEKEALWKIQWSEKSTLSLVAGSRSSRRMFGRNAGRGLAFWKTFR